jgi:hypothetical protein
MDADPDPGGSKIFGSYGSDTGNSNDFRRSQLVKLLPHCIPGEDLLPRRMQIGVGTRTKLIQLKENSILPFLGLYTTF